MRNPVEKMKGFPGRLIFAGVLLFCATVVAGGSCATEVGDVDRTQQNVVPKSVFNDGSEWYYVRTVLDVPYNTGYTFSGEQTASASWSNADKIVWDVQEKFLIARKSYEMAEGAEKERVDNGKQPGTPVVAFAIADHFDVKRDYNPATGEQKNVIVENNQDRKWWERDYMRPDWSRDLAPNLDPLYAMYFAALNIDKISPLSFYVEENEEASPYRIEITKDYVSFVNKYQIEANYEECFAYFGYTEMCGASEITVRHSFMRKTAKFDDYVPQEYPDNVYPLDPVTGDRMLVNYDKMWLVSGLETCKRGEIPWEECYFYTIPLMQSFGFFRTETPSYDHNRGITYEGMHRYINRHNIFTGWRDEEGKIKPVYERKVRPIVYHLSVNFDEDLKQAAIDGVGGEWNRVFRTAVKAAVNVFDKTADGEPGRVASAMGTASCGEGTVCPGILECGVEGKCDVPDVFIVKDNDCTIEKVKKFVGEHPALARHMDRLFGGVDKTTAMTLPNACAALEYHTAGYAEAERFTWQKTGDLRYSFITWWNSPFSSSPLGYGPSAADPENGQIIQANANIYGAPLDFDANRAVDYMWGITGRLKRDDILSNEYVRDALKKSREEAAALMATAGDGKMDVSRLLTGTRIPEVRTGLAAGKRIPLDMLRKPGAIMSRPSSVASERIERIRGTELESLLTPPEVKFELIPGFGSASAPDSALKMASPAEWFTPDFLYKRKAFINKLLSRNITPAEFGEVQMQGYALTLWDRCEVAKEFLDEELANYACAYQDMSREDFFKQVRVDDFIPVTIHEVGHTVGLRHNFEASWDALNYHDKFWEIWDEAKDLAPRERYLKMIEKGAQGYMYSSIMDYQSRLTHESSGLGKWDLASVKAGYTGVVEVFEDEVVRTLKDNGVGSRYSTPGTAFWLRSNANLPALFAPQGDLSKGAANIKKRRDVAFEDLVGQYTAWLYCTREGSRDEDTEKNLDLCNNIPHRGFTPWDVPYTFGGDEYSGPPGGSPSVQIFDHGMTHLERVTDARRQYEAYYFWRNFSNDKFENEMWGRVYKVPIYYLMPITDIYQYFFLYYAIIGGEIVDPQEVKGYEFLSDFAMASIYGLNFLSEVVATPSYGNHCKVTAAAEDYGLRPDAYYPVSMARGTCDENAPLVEIPLGTGRPRYTKYRDDPYSKWDPESWGYQAQIIGSFMEKSWAMQALSSTASFFYGIDFLSALGLYDINTWRLFPDEMLNLLGGLMVGAPMYDKFAGHIKDGEYVPPKVICPETRFPGAGFEPLCAEVEGADVVYPADSFTLSYYAALSGFAYMSTYMDGQRGFEDYARIVVKGGQQDFFDALDVVKNDPTLVHEVSDPSTGITYRALQTQDGNSVAIRIVDLAADIAAKRAAAAEKIEQNPEDLEARADFMSYDMNLSAWLDHIANIRKFGAVLGTEGWWRDTVSASME